MCIFSIEKKKRSERTMSGKWLFPATEREKASVPLQVNVRPVSYLLWWGCPSCTAGVGLQCHDALGTSNMHRLLYFCSSWFLVRTCSRSVVSCCCCSPGLQSIPGMLEICSRASWIFVFSLASSWWTSWLSLSMLSRQGHGWVKHHTQPVRVFIGGHLHFHVVSDC